MTIQVLESTAECLATIRSILKTYNLIEVFTPIMHSRLDPGEKDSHFQIENNEIFTENLFLRFCMELRLRQLLKFQNLNGIYEIGACFRKEPEPDKICEFHMLELFEKMSTYENLMRQIIEICKTVNENNGGVDLDIDTIPVIDLVSNAEIESFRCFSRNDSDYIKQFEACLNTKLDSINKTKRAYIIYDYPVETMSLAKRKKENPSFVERFELFIDGEEIGHGFTDAIDANDVEDRMEKLGWQDDALLMQLRKNELPESGGFGIGIERLVQVSLGIKSIQDMIVPQIL